jgi:GNAT superfamily N-acetyltransferase
MARRTLLVRAADAADLGAVRDLDSLAQTARDRSERLVRAQAEGRLVVAERDGAVVGYVIQAGFFEYDFLELLVVHPSHRRQGVATALVEAIESRSRTGKLFTSTNRSNAAMQRLCEALGFQPSGVVDNLDDRDPELFYYKPVALPNAD